MARHACWLCLLTATTALTASAQTPPAETAAQMPLEAPYPRTLPQDSVPPAPAPGAGPGCRDPEPQLLTLQLTELKDNFRKLKTEREALQAERLTSRQPRHDASLAKETAKLRLQLVEMLARLDHNRSQPAVTAPQSTLPTPPKVAQPAQETQKQPAQKTAVDETPPAKTSAPADTDRPLDPLALAQTLFKAEDYQTSLRAYRMIDLKGLKAEQRLPIQYMIATCLKHLGKISEASAVYREIANSRGDEQVAACAQWQLSALRWQQEMQTQLHDIRERRKTLENPP
jgi:hypothetical protein